MKKPKLLLITALSLLTACTDATRASYSALGDAAKVVCYSGGVVIYEGKSTGRVSSTASSDGWEFMEAETGNFVRVSGDCVVTN